MILHSQVQKNALDLEELLTYSLARVTHCLGTPDGFFAKINKPSLLHFLIKGNVEEVKYSTQSMFIQDGNALFHFLICLVPTFGGVSLQMLNQLSQKQNFIFSTNSYHKDSIKSQKRAQRGTGDQLIYDVSAIRTPNHFTSCFYQMIEKRNNYATC